GAPGNADAIRRILAATGLKVQVGGGIRNEQALQTLFAAGTARAVIGSIAVTSPGLASDWLVRYGPERIVLALDVRVRDEAPEVLTHGWTRGSQQSLWDVLDEFRAVGLRHLLCTDVDRDGAMQGPNERLY